MNEDQNLILFEIKQKFLREIPHPKLIVKQIKILEQKGGIVDKAKLDLNVITLSEELKKQSLSTFLDEYITKSLKQKHQIAIGNGFENTRNNLRLLYEIQVQFLKKIASYLNECEEINTEKVKMSTPIDAYVLLKCIQNLKLEENQIKPYLCSAIKNSSQSYLDKLLEGVLGAYKIVNHV